MAGIRFSATGRHRPVGQWSRCSHVAEADLPVSQSRLTSSLARRRSACKVTRSPCHLQTLHFRKQAICLPAPSLILSSPSSFQPCVGLRPAPLRALPHPVLFPLCIDVSRQIFFWFMLAFSGRPARPAHSGPTPPHPSRSRPGVVSPRPAPGPFSLALLMSRRQGRATPGLPADGRRW